MKNPIYLKALFVFGICATINLSAQSTENTTSITVNTHAKTQRKKTEEVVSTTASSGKVGSSSNSNAVFLTKDALEVPSAFRYLVEYCELKDGSYLLPREKFIELTEQQQNIITTSVPKFKLKD